MCFFLSSCFYVFLFRFFSAECFPMNMFVLWNDKTITWEPIRIIAYREWQANAEPLHSESSAIFTKTLYVSLYGYVSSRLRKMVNVIKKNSLERDSFYTPIFFFHLNPLSRVIWCRKRLHLIWILHVINFWLKLYPCSNNVLTSTIFNIRNLNKRTQCRSHSNRSTLISTKIHFRLVHVYECWMSDS